MYVVLFANICARRLICCLLPLIGREKSIFVLSSCEKLSSTEEKLGRESISHESGTESAVEALLWDVLEMAGKWIGFSEAETF